MKRYLLAIVMCMGMLMGYTPATGMAAETQSFQDTYVYTDPDDGTDYYAYQIYKDDDITEVHLKSAAVRGYSREFGYRFTYSDNQWYFVRGVAVVVGDEMHWIAPWKTVDGRNDAQAVLNFALNH